MPTIRSTAIAIGLTTLCAAGLSAQTQETKTTTSTKIEITGGKDVTVRGCLDRTPNGDYVLAKVATKRKQDPTQYSLVTTEDLSKHVGERLEVRGKVVANGNGKVSVETTTKTEVEHGKEHETKGKTEGAIGDIPFLGVSSTKTLGASCS